MPQGIDNGSDFLGLANLISSIYDGRGEIKLFQYESTLKLTSLELKSAKQIQSALNTSYGTTRHVLSYLQENKLLAVDRKTRGGKEWYARTYKDMLAMVFDQLYWYIEMQFKEKGIAQSDAVIVREHCDLIFKAIFEQIESAPFDLRWKGLVLAGLDLMIEKNTSSSHGLPRLCICPEPASWKKCERCSLKAYSIDCTLKKYYDPFGKAGIKSTQISKEVRAIKKFIAPRLSKEVVEYTLEFKRDFGTFWDCARLFCISDELFLEGKLNREIYESKVLSTFRKIVSPI